MINQNWSAYSKVDPLERGTYVVYMVACNTLIQHFEHFDKTNTKFIHNNLTWVHIGDNLVVPVLGRSKAGRAQCIGPVSSGASFAAFLSSLDHLAPSII